MSTHLPRVYVAFNEQFPDVAEAHGALARTIRERSPFDERTERLLTLALAIGAQAEGAVRSNVRKALEHGATADQIQAVALAAITTCGFPTAMAGLRWIDEVLGTQDDESAGSDPA